MAHWTVLRGLLPFVWPEGRPDLRWRVGLAFVLLVAAKLITIAVPVFFKEATDALAAAPSAPGLAATAGAFILAYGLGRVLVMALTQVRDVWFMKVGQHAARTLNNRIFQHLHRLSLRFHLERRTGGLSRVIERGTRGIDLIVRMGLLNIVPTALELVLVSGLLLVTFGWVFALAVVGTIALYLWFTFAASEWRIAIRREMNDSDTEANTKAIDSLLNFETVKYFGNEAHEARRFDASMARYEAAAVRTYTSLGVLNLGQAVIFTAGMTLVMWLAAREILAGRATAGDFVMVNALLIQLYMPLNFMGMVYREIRQGLTDLESLFELLASAPEIRDAPNARPLSASRGTIRFENVSFAYEPDRPILKNVSFEVPAGRMVAVVGSSGAGKSTIGRILFRFYDIQDGRVTIGGEDIRAITLESLRAAIGVVPQDTVLFNGTILYNIRYGRPEASDAEVEDAARLAQIDGFIRSLPMGYRTMVGERGLKLSGGEKQRVAIARALLKGPPILLLDEATSALDSHTEKDIQAALEKAARGRTTLVIAHRLSTIVHASSIIVLDGGQVAEQGTHEDLIARGGLYAGLWSRQQRAASPRREQNEESLPAGRPSPAAERSAAESFPDLTAAAG